MKQFSHIAISGLGLIGGSIARDIRRLGLADTISGFGRNPERLRKAASCGLIDAGFTSFESCIGQADLVIIGTPVRLIPQQVRCMLPCVKQGTIITDVGSVKTAIVQDIEPAVPADIHFIGGHPIAGTENSGFEAAQDGLFQNRVCVLTPTEKTDMQALEKLETFWKALGSTVVRMDIRSHDKIFAGISHLPHMVAFSLVNAVADMESVSKEILKYSAGGFRDFTRIAASDPAMWRDIALMNREQILQALGQFERSLATLKHYILGCDPAGIESFFRRSHDTRRSIEHDDAAHT